MFEQCFKNIDDILRKDAGASNELDYVEQTSWLLFLKYLEDLEKEKAGEAALNGKTYSPILAPEFSWSTWAYPTKDGKLDFHRALTGDDLKVFVDTKLFPYLASFKVSAASPDTLEYKIGEIFSELKNKIQSGYNMRDVIDIIASMKFQTSAEKHELSALYEDKIQNMGNTGRNGGEYYTPRPLIRTIVKALKPRIGDRIYDGAVGSAGFLVEAFDYLRRLAGSAEDMRTLQERTLYGKEKKPLPYVIAIMNMILHGVEAPNIVRTNTLAEDVRSIQSSQRYDLIIANPPFGGKERAEVQQNFPIKTSETAYLFLQHFIASLRAGANAGIVIKNTFLSNSDAAALRKELLTTCNLYAVLDLPAKVFTAGVKTVVLFFKKGEPTREIWYYQLNLNRNLGKTSPLTEADLADFLARFDERSDSENSWRVDISSVLAPSYDLSVKNPNKVETADYKTPSQIIDEISNLDVKAAEILAKIKWNIQI